MHSAIKAKQLGKGEDKIMKDKLSTLKNKIINNSNELLILNLSLIGINYMKWILMVFMTLKLELLNLKNN